MASLEELLEVGAHFGHKASRWNPKMAPYIFTTRNKFHIIDLDKTAEKLKLAVDFVDQIVKMGGSILFVGTKRQAKTIIRKYAADAGQLFVAERWLGGTLTNFKTIQKSIKKLSTLEEKLAAPDAGKYTKKERLMMEREVAKSKVLFEGLRNLKKLPEAVFVLDTITDKIAVIEAQTTKVPVIGIVDTNSDPTGIDYVIPANDDAIKSLDLITKTLAAAAKNAKSAVKPDLSPTKENRKTEPVEQVLKQ